MKMELQLALDMMEKEKAAELVKKVHRYVDIVEIGTPFIIKNGIGFISEIKEIDPRIKILCDTKIMDAGYFEAEEVFRAGADYVTVLALTDHETLSEGVMAAKRYGKEIMVDMICVTDIRQKVEELESAGVDIIAVHTGVDQQKIGRTPIDDLIEIKKYVQKCKVAVAGGIRPDTIGEYIKYEPDIVIVGSGIVDSENPMAAAKRIYETVKNPVEVNVRYDR